MAMSPTYKASISHSSLLVWQLSCFCPFHTACCSSSHSVCSVCLDIRCSNGWQKWKLFWCLFWSIQRENPLLDWVYTLLSELFLSCILIQHSRRSCTQSACDLPCCYTTSSRLAKPTRSVQEVANRHPGSFLLRNLAATASATFYSSREKQAIIGNLSVFITFLTFIGIIFYHLWKHILLSKFKQFKTRCTRNRSSHHQTPQDSSSESSGESDGMEPVQLQPLVLEFDHYREPVLKYADSDWNTSTQTHQDIKYVHAWQFFHYAPIQITTCTA